MELETETCPLTEVDNIDSLSVDQLKASLRSETGERRRKFKSRLKASPHFGRRAETCLTQAA